MGIQKISSGWALLKRFTIHELTGEVIDQNAGSHTEVTGKIYGGGTISPGTVSPVQGKIETETTHFQTLYLLDDDGVEHVVQTIDLTVPCRAGHKLTVWRLGKSLWVKAFNHNTRESYTSDKLSKKMFPVIFYFIFGFWFAGWVMSDAGTDGAEFGIFFLMYWLVGLAIGVIPSKIIAWYRISVLNRSIKKNSLALNGGGVATEAT